MKDEDMDKKKREHIDFNEDDEVEGLKNSRNFKVSERVVGCYPSNSYIHMALMLDMVGHSNELKNYQGFYLYRSGDNVSVL
jgi:hypothetical protein